VEIVGVRSNPLQAGQTTLAVSALAKLSTRRGPRRDDPLAIGTRGHFRLFSRFNPRPPMLTSAWTRLIFNANCTWPHRKSNRKIRLNCAFGSIHSSIESYDAQNSITQDLSHPNVQAATRAYDSARQPFSRRRARSEVRVTLPLRKRRSPYQPTFERDDKIGKVSVFDAACRGTAYRQNETPHSRSFTALSEPDRNATDGHWSGACHPPTIDRVVAAEICLMRDDRFAEFGQREPASKIVETVRPDVSG
jgi:hypothetical protein